MAQVTLQINGKPYVVGCEDGQEQRLHELADQFDSLVRSIGADVGQIGETRLFLMAALMAADESAELRIRLAHTQSDLGRLQTEYARLEARAVAGFENAAKRIEKIAAN